MRLTFFCDRNLGKAFPERLKQAGIVAVAHDDVFAQNTADPVWIPEVAKRDWIAVSHDRRIRYKGNERDAVIEADLRLLLLTGRAPFPVHAENFIRTLTRIERFVAINPQPWIAKLHRPSQSELLRRPNAAGTVERWFPPK